jgi:HlyD family secretion protein
MKERSIFSKKNLIIALAVLAAGVGIYFLVHKPALPEGLIQVNGRIEGDAIILSSKYNGKIARLLVREGDDVEQGQTAITLDDPETRARLAQAQRAYDASLATARVAGQNVGYTSEVGAATIQQARGQVQQASDGIRDAEAAVSASEASVRMASEAVDGAASQLGAAEAKLQSAEMLVGSYQAQAKQSSANAERYRNLVQEGLVTEQLSEQYVTAAAKDQAQLDSTVAEADSARAEVAARESGLERAQHQLAVATADLGRAQAQLAAARARRAEAEGVLRQAETAPLQVAMSSDSHASAQSQVHEAEAKVDEQASILSSMSVVSPTSGKVTTRIRDVGEVVTAGSPILEIVDLDRLYLKAYVPGNQIGKIRLGLPAQVYVDAYPGEPFDATVRYISSAAEFTPKEVQTPDERVKLVYAIKLYLKNNPDHRLTPGMPADAIVRWKEGVPWEKPRY